MRLIDEKGRLFGRINIVDFLIILLCAIVIPGFLYSYNIFKKIPIRVPHQWVRVRTITFVIPEIVDLFKIGDVVYGEEGHIDGKLVKIERKDDVQGNGLKKALLRESSTNLYEFRIPVFLEFELLCTKSAKKERYYYRRNPLLTSLGKSITIDSENYTIDAFVLKIYE